MTRIKTTARRILVVVVAMLAGVGAWEIARGTVLWAQGVPGFKPGETPLPGALVCYRIEDSDDSRHVEEAAVKIYNDFEVSIVRVKDDDSLLCVPTDAAKLPDTPKDRDRRK